MCVRECGRDEEDNKEWAINLEEACVHLKLARWQKGHSHIGLLHRAEVRFEHQSAADVDLVEDGSVSERWSSDRLDGRNADVLVHLTRSGFDITPIQTNLDMKEIKLLTIMLVRLR